MDFPNPKDLANYLLYLDKNNTAYNEYFKWKKHIKKSNHIPSMSMICDMCIKLHLETFFGIERKKIDNMDFLNKRHCKQPNPNKKTFFNLEDI